jgi:amino acid transporter
MAVQTDTKLNPEQQLARGSLTLPDAIAISVSVIAPGMAAFLNVPGVAVQAGGSTPLAFLFGGIGCLALAFVVIGFTRRMASAGYAYTYASRSLGKSAGFMAGWMYAFGMACFVPMTMAGVAYLFSDLVGLSTSWWFWLFLIGMGLLVVLSIVRIKVTTRLQILVGAVTVAVIVIVSVITIAKGGAHGNSGGPFTFSHTVSRSSASRPPPISVRRPRTRGATSRSQSSPRRRSRSSSTCWRPTPCRSGSASIALASTARAPTTCSRRLLTTT